MLTADLVRVRKKGTELSVSELGDKLRPRALELAEDYIALAEAHVGATRAELEEAWEGVKVSASERKIALGLCKLVEDRIAFDVQSEPAPSVLRSEVFLAAAEVRKNLSEGEQFARAPLLLEHANRYGMVLETLERGLYADLRSAQILTDFSSITATRLVASYDLAQKQAVLLKAESIVATVRCRDPYAYRALFRKLKFFRLMHRIEPQAEGYRIVIDGPFSLFGASTKYGLELALSLPALLACDHYDITAQLRWGKERARLTFTLQGEGKGQEQAPLRLPDEVETFFAKFQALESPWQAQVSSDILEVRGAGLCVPDLRFVHSETGEVCYLEVLGYWSRDAVWKRVELCERGLRERVIFAASSRLRVSEEVLDESAPSQLYMYKGVLSAKEVLSRLSGARQTQ